MITSVCVSEEEERTQTLKVDSMKNKCAIERRIVDIVKKKVDQHNSSATVEQVRDTLGRFYWLMNIFIKTG